MASKLISPTASSSNPPSTVQRGLLIVIEGLDRSGKTTQATNLVNSIAERHQINSTSAVLPVHLQKFPDRTTPTGTLINSYLTNQSQQDDHAIHLLFSANRWEARDKILSLLLSGTTVIVDRYSFSGAVYSAAKGKESLDLTWCWAMEVGLPRPDLVVFLDLDFEVAKIRGGWGEERYEVEGMQKRVRKLYHDLLGRLPARSSDQNLGADHGQDGRETNEMLIGIVDAGVDIEEVRRRIWECYLDCARRVYDTNGVATAIGRLGPLQGQ